jgi:prepilin-type N-terminal cleavage/methylation domain-containing protein
VDQPGWGRRDVAESQLSRIDSGMRTSFTRHRPGQRGFTLVEVLLATVIMVVGLVAVAQLVPASLTISSQNRSDSAALVIQQRILEQMAGQPLTATTCLAPVCPDAQTTWSLGTPASPGTVSGNAVTMVNGAPAIDFGTGAVGGYGFTYNDPEDPYGTSFDVRWAVVTYVNGTNVTAKRFLISARQLGGNGFFPPITLDTTVEK